MCVCMWCVCVCVCGMCAYMLVCMWLHILYVCVCRWWWGRGNVEVINRVHPCVLVQLQVFVYMLCTYEYLCVPVLAIHDAVGVIIQVTITVVTCNEV